jgi:hypothetical protein
MNNNIEEWRAEMTRLMTSCGIGEDRRLRTGWVEN